MTTTTQAATRRPFLSTVVDELRARRAARAEAKRLEAELATYTHPGELEDLMATLERYDTPDAEQIRTILVRNAA